MKENLKGLTVTELEERLALLGHPTFRGRQLFRWIYQEKVDDFEKMFK